MELEFPPYLLHMHPWSYVTQYTKPLQNHHAQSTLLKQVSWLMVQLHPSKPTGPASHHPMSYILATLAGPIVLRYVTTPSKTKSWRFAPLVISMPAFPLPCIAVILSGLAQLPDHP